ncbi:hypothetical protein B0H14DRAFT_3454016 [Mycena olivaceomarginata]|nr:hypothetical protein B0H14DRAFT_3454016 [Mycena olivaceomarginata]
MQGLRALWGDALPLDCTYFGLLQSLVGPIIDAMFVESVREQKLMREGKPLPAREYSEDASPYASHWWPENVNILHREASREEDCLKDDFRRLFPCQPVVHPDREAQAENFRRASRFLNAKLACSSAIFFLRTRLQEGITASAAARAGAVAFYQKIEAEKAAAIAAAYGVFFG